ncbi:hypothetical protein ACOQ0N_004605 [Vibrio parahaemolyticus]
MEKIGIAITILWTTLVSLLVYFKWSDATVMSLNEWGDFLAGVTAPIAFLWLIIGYMLQRKELNLNTSALTASRDEIERQANELIKQTEYLGIQAKAAEEQRKQIRQERLAMRRKAIATESNETRTE